MSEDASSAQPTPDPAAVRLAPWVGGMLAVLAGEAQAEVPCGSCTACCTSRQFIHVAADESAALAAIPGALLFPAPGTGDSTMILGYDERGHCPMFTDGRCSIYAVRPRACRAYDCRIFTATGIAPDADKPSIADRAARWRLSIIDRDDAAEQQAMKSALEFLRRVQDDIEPALRPASASQAAVVTLLLSRAFLKPGVTSPDEDLPVDDAAARVALLAILESATSR